MKRRARKLGSCVVFPRAAFLSFLWTVSFSWTRPLPSGGHPSGRVLPPSPLFLFFLRFITFVVVVARCAAFVRRRIYLIRAGLACVIPYCQLRSTLSRVFFFSFFMARGDAVLDKTMGVIASLAFFFFSVHTFLCPVVKSAVVSRGAILGNRAFFFFLF